DSYAPSAASLAKEIGAKHAKTLAAVTAAADVIFTVVTDDASQYGVFAEKGDSLLIKAKGKVFINCATLTPKTHVEVERRAKKAGAVTLEGCMASSIPQARNGTLYLMCGGAKKTFVQVKPILEKLSSALRYVGKTGQAAQVKALVNMVMNINTAGLAEGLGLAQSLGHDLKMICEVFSQTGANSRVLETDADDMIAREHDCWFSAEHAAKDSGIAAGLAKDRKLNLPLNDAAKAQYDRMVGLGIGGLDKSGIAELTFPGRAGSEKKKKKSDKKKK
ncbi:MAG: NAD(P)-dependent oxidoreductase, partial [Verrucomicrobiales bacterium]|nr:NAD(P)-dependent oxidoreductase [Verrucomicrobiales bacterium]